MKKNPKKTEGIIIILKKKKGVSVVLCHLHLSSFRRRHLPLLLALAFAPVLSCRPPPPLPSTIPGKPDCPLPPFLTPLPVPHRLGQRRWRCRRSGGRVPSASTDRAFSSDAREGNQSPGTPPSEAASNVPTTTRSKHPATRIGLTDSFPLVKWIALLINVIVGCTY